MGRGTSGGTSFPHPETAWNRQRRIGRRAASVRCRARRSSFRCRSRMTTDSLPPAIQRSVLKYRDYRLFLLARLLMTAAIQIQSVAVGYQVYELTSDPLQLGFVGLAQFLPMLALILPAGDFADRFNRRTILLIS